MPKTSSNDRINTAFEEIAEALNNPKLQQGFLNGNKENEILNELVDIFDRKRSHEIKRAEPSIEKSHNSIRASHLKNIPNTNKIPYVPARVDPIPWYRTKDRPPRMNPNSNAKKIVHVRKTVASKEKSDKLNIPTPLTHFPNGTAIYKFFNKKYWKGRVIRFNPKQDYYIVHYDDNDEEELTHKEITSYLIPPAQGDY